ncbi:hypothetical protein Bca101_067359 [Brassica carinata]
MGSPGILGNKENLTFLWSSSKVENGYRFLRISKYRLAECAGFSGWAKLLGGDYGHEPVPPDLGNRDAETMSHITLVLFFSDTGFYGLHYKLPHYSPVVSSIGAVVSSYQTLNIGIRNSDPLLFFLTSVCFTVAGKRISKLGGGALPGHAPPSSQNCWKSERGKTRSDFSEHPKSQPSPSPPSRKPRHYSTTRRSLTLVLRDDAPRSRQPRIASISTKVSIERERADKIKRRGERAAPPAPEPPGGS